MYAKRVKYILLIKILNDKRYFINYSFSRPRLRRRGTSRAATQPTLNSKQNLYGEEKRYYTRQLEMQWCRRTPRVARLLRTQRCNQVSSVLRSQYNVAIPAASHAAMQTYGYILGGPPRTPLPYITRTPRLHKQHHTLPLFSCLRVWWYGPLHVSSVRKLNNLLNLNRRGGPSI